METTCINSCSNAVAVAWTALPVASHAFKWEQKGHLVRPSIGGVAQVGRRATRSSVCKSFLSTNRCCPSREHVGRLVSAEGQERATQNCDRRLLSNATLSSLEGSYFHALSQLNFLSVPSLTLLQNNMNGLQNFANMPRHLRTQ